MFKPFSNNSNTFANKSNYDTGRFRYMLDFKLLVATDDGAGGTTQTKITVLSTKAVREKLSEHNQLAIAAGASYLTNDCFFVIRNRPGFYPTKDMQIVCAGDTYTLRAFIEIDVPVKYLKLLCAKNDGPNQGFSPST